MSRKKLLAVLSPVAVIALGFLCAHIAGVFLREWAFVPLALLYWGATFAFAYGHMGGEGIRRLFAKPKRGVLWPILCCVVGLIPLPIFLLNLNLLRSPGVTALWLLFALVNPFFEEVYWRGYLLEALPFPKRLAAAYSAALFVASHPLMWGVFSIANRSWMTWASLALMGVVWSLARLRTGNLRWCAVSHFAVDIFNLSVFVFLNLYIPPVM